MHSKNNNKTQTFIQGLRPFSSSIPKTLKKYLRKGGFNYSNIVDNWTKMVSKKVSDACYPISVKMGKDMKNGILILNVVHGKELEIEYEKKEIDLCQRLRGLTVSDDLDECTDDREENDQIYMPQMVPNGPKWVLG